MYERPAVYLCRKIRLFEFLANKGFRPKKTLVDKYDSKRFVWLYDNTPELENAVKEYYRNIPQKNDVNE